jgi:outer membrane autotransporter protein
MNRTDINDNSEKLPGYRQASGCCGLDVNSRFAAKSFLIGLLLVFVLIPAVVHSQSLNDAVTAQLQLNLNNGNPCDLLLDGNPASPTELRGNLLNICTGGPSGAPGAASSVGGGAATPTSLPGVVGKRLEKARGEEETEASSTESVLEIGRYSVFVSGEYENLDKDKNTFQDGYNSIIRRLTLGGDVQLTQKVVAGLALDTYAQHGNFNEPGNFDVNSYRFVGYGSFLPIGDLYVQVSANYGITTNKRQRSTSFSDPNSTSSALPVSGQPRANFDADQYGAFVRTGYGFSFGPVTLTPRAGYEWQRMSYATYRESGNSGLELKYDSFDITSSLSTLGLMGSIAFGTRYGVLVPQASFDWKHQFDLDQQKLDVSFIDDLRSKKFSYQNEEPDRDYYEINAGLVFVMPNGLQAFGNYRTITSNSLYDSDAYTLGLRYEF